MIDKVFQWPRRIFLWQLSTRRFLKHHLPWANRDVGSMRDHAFALVDLFATILTHRRDMSARDADAALDILRYTYPEVAHSLLSGRFERSMRARLPLQEVLSAVVAGRREEADRMAVAIEVMSLLTNAGDYGLVDAYFDEVTEGLGVPGVTGHLRSLMTARGVEAREPAFSVSLGVGAGHEVQLSPRNRGVTLRVIRCARLVMVVNDGELPVVVRGRSLLPGHSMPLTSGQVVVMPAGGISFEDLAFLVDTKRTGRPEQLYLQLNNGVLEVSRNRVRGSQVRVSMGLGCALHVLRRDVNLTVNKTPLASGVRDVELRYFDALYINGEGPFRMHEIRFDVADMGRRFELDPAKRKVRLTNLPERANKGDMLLTPDLGAGVVLEVSFSRDTNSGGLDVIEATSPIYVNGKLVRGNTALYEGDIISINMFQSLRCRFHAGVLDEDYTAIRSVTVEGVSKEFGRNGLVLDNVDFAVRRGEMACVLGPSGSGKSTLLSLMGGHLPPTRGRVLFNDESLYENPSLIRPHVALIPRGDILDAQMSVEEHLHQATIIRRPRLVRTERKRRVNSVMKYLGLNHIASRRVGELNERTISDGERTRLNLGLDMTGIANVFLIDEPTSGLSSSDSLMVMETLQSMARERIVVATMHRPSVAVLNMFQKILVLDHGGQVAYWGDVKGVMHYFRKVVSDYNITISEGAVTAGGADYIFEALEAPLKWHDRRRRQHPRFWQEQFEGHKFRNAMGGADMQGSVIPQPQTIRDGSEGASSSSVPARPPRSPRQLWSIFRLWVERTFLGRVRSRMGLYTMLLEAPVLALLIALTLRASNSPDYTFKTALHIPPYLFLASVVAMFFGLTGAASEVLKERTLLLRESNYRFFVSGYVVAKALVLTFLASIQSALFLIVGNLVLEVDKMFPFYWATMTLTAFVGVSISFFISVFARTERAALNMVPLVLIPQILMAGAMIPFEDMNQFIPWSAHRADEHGRLKSGRVPLVAELCPLRFSYEMLVVEQATMNPWEKERDRLQSMVDEFKNKPRKLTEEERLNMRLMLQGLTALSSAEAQDAEESLQVIRTIRRASSSGNQTMFERLIAELEQQAQLGGRPTLSFFVNDRILGLHEFAEAQRQSRETFDRPSIFLAKRQPVIFGGDDKDPDEEGYTADKGTMPTTARNAIFLLIMGVFPLVISGLALRRRFGI